MSVVTADNSVQTQANKDTDLTAKKAGDLAMATVHLFSNNITPTPQTPVGSYMEAVFTGYAAKAIAGWTANEWQLDGSVSTTGTGVLSWVGPADASGQTIYGYFVLSAGAGTPLIYASLFANPVSLSRVTDVLDLVPTYRVP